MEVFVTGGKGSEGRAGADRTGAVRVAWAGLAALALVGAVIGAWAAVSPRSFYDRFPGGGRAWVAADGPYNEHLVRDFGNLNLALSVVTAVALLALARTAAPAVAAAAGWLAYQVPHFVYHLRHLDLYDKGDQVLNMASLGLSVALPIVVLVAVSRAHGSIAQAVHGRRSRG